MKLIIKLFLCAALFSVGSHSSKITKKEAGLPADTQSISVNEIKVVFLKQYRDLAGDNDDGKAIILLDNGSAHDFSSVPTESDPEAALNTLLDQYDIEAADCQIEYSDFESTRVYFVRFRDDSEREKSKNVGVRYLKKRIDSTHRDPVVAISLNEFFTKTAQQGLTTGTQLSSRTFKKEVTLATQTFRFLQSVDSVQFKSALVSAFDAHENSSSEEEEG